MPLPNGLVHDCIETAKILDRLLRERLSGAAASVAELEAAGVSNDRIEVLYPFDLEDYEAKVVELFTTSPDFNDFLLQELQRLMPHHLLINLPSGIYAHNSAGMRALTASLKRSLPDPYVQFNQVLGYLHSVARFDPQHEVDKAHVLWREVTMDLAQVANFFYTLQQHPDLHIPFE